MSVVRVEFDLRSVPGSPISFSRKIESEKETGEDHAHFEERTWRERLHVDTEGYVYIPPAAFKHCLEDCAKFLQESVPGKGKATYTKNFEAGVLCTTPMRLPIKAKDVKSERLFVPSDGKKGGGTRVWKIFPIIEKWDTTGDLMLLDPLLTGNPEKVHEYMVHAGKFIGLGRYRPRRGGFYGRFTVERFECEEVS